MEDQNIDPMNYPKRLVADQMFGPMLRFFRLEAASSILLLFATFLALVWANSAASETYAHFWHTEVALFWGPYRMSHSLVHWVNDGLMAVFFFIVGLEIKRETLVGELSSPKIAMLPVIAALGGMVVPGLIYWAFNHGGAGMNGWAIPMATDIAFAIGAIAVFGTKLPVGLRIFLAAFAIADDLGAVLIIAIFYSKHIAVNYLLISAGFACGMAVLNLLRIRFIPLYVFLGFGLWLAVLGSGIHPTIAGVIGALFIPVRAKYDAEQFAEKVNTVMDNYQCNVRNSCYWYSILLNRDHLNCVHAVHQACTDVETPLQRLEHALHPYVAFLILPVFACGNAGLSLQGLDLTEALLHPVTVGIALGLLVGKPVGIAVFAWLAVRLNLASLPEGVNWSHMIGAGMLGGIGFTMSLFVSGLSFTDQALSDYSKMGILAGSILAALAGMAFLALQCKRQQAGEGAT